MLFSNISIKKVWIINNHRVFDNTIGIIHNYSRGINSIAQTCCSIPLMNIKIYNQYTLYFIWVLLKSQLWGYHNIIKNAVSFPIIVECMVCASSYMSCHSEFMLKAGSSFVAQ